MSFSNYTYQISFLTKNSIVYDVMHQLMDNGMFPILLIDDKDNEYFRQAVLNKPEDIPELELIIISLTPLNPYSA